MEKESMQNVMFVNNRVQYIFLVTLTLMSMAGLVGSDIYLPTLPAIGEALSQDVKSMQLTLGVYLLGISVGQLLLGPLSDCFGRRKLLLSGMLLYGLSSIGCACSSTLTELLIFRLLQAIGACSGLVIGRAIIGDLFKPADAGKIFATIFPFVGMSPAISPVIGGFIGHYFSWQANFIFVSFFALSVFLLVFVKIPESLGKEDRKKFVMRDLFTTYPALLMERKFIYYCLAPCTAYIAFFSYIAQSPFLLHAHGYGQRAIGISYITLSLTYVAGGLVSKRYLKKYNIDNVIEIGFKFFLCGAFLFLLASIFHLQVIFLILSISILTFGNGFLIPLGTAGVVSSFSGRVGLASGLLGFLQLGAAAVTSALIGGISANNIVYLATFIFTVALLGSALHRIVGYKKAVSVVN